MSIIFIGWLTYEDLLKKYTPINKLHNYSPQSIYTSFSIINFEKYGKKNFKKNQINKIKK